MIITQSSDHDSPEKRDKQLEDINVYLLIPQAKPVISPTRKYANERKNQNSFNNFQNSIFRNKILFKKQATIANGFNFSSSHESGNIQNVQEIQFDHYYLKVRPDTNSKHQSQWFYFQVKGIKKAKFIIYGFKKSKSLFNSGMKLCIKQQKWKRSGSNICYYKQGQSFAVKFDYVFKNSEQITEIAYCFPYTLTDLREYINNLFNNKNYKKFLKKQTIGQSFDKNQIICLTFDQSLNSHKPIIFIMSRVHPGETVSSFVLRGAIEALLKDEKATKALLQNYQIKIIPMLNPDGVKLGNYRFSYTGRDLNRQWKSPTMNLSPQIVEIREYIQKFHDRICMIIDLHGHSRKKDAFFYGCQTQEDHNFNARKFPYLMSKISDSYSYQKSNFNVQKSKEGTARIYLWKLLKIPYIYTLECSFCGSEKSTKNFDIEDLENIGSKLIEGMAIFYSDKFKGEYSDTQELKKKILSEFEAQKDRLHTINSQDGSDSQPSEGKLEQAQVLTAIKQQSNKKLKSTSHHSHQVKYNSSVKLQQQHLDPKYTNPVRNFRKRVSNSLKTTKHTIKPQNSLFNFHKQDDYEIKRKNDKYLQELMQREKKRHLLNEIQDKNSHNLQFLNYFNQREKHMQSAAKLIQDYQQISHNEINDFSSSHFDFQFSNEDQLQIRTPPNNINFGAQYIRVKNYAQKLNPKPKTTSNLIYEEYNHNLDKIKKKQCKDLKINVTSLKLHKHPELNMEHMKSTLKHPTKK